MIVAIFRTDLKPQANRSEFGALHQKMPHSPRFSGNVLSSSRLS